METINFSLENLKNVLLTYAVDFILCEEHLSTSNVTYMEKVFAQKMWSIREGIQLNGTLPGAYYSP